jgi:hypothetical protein
VGTVRQHSDVPEKTGEIDNGLSYRDVEELLVRDRFGDHRGC